jgi:hypothetical protein
MTLSAGSPKPCQHAALVSLFACAPSEMRALAGIPAVIGRPTSPAERSRLRRPARCVISAPLCCQPASWSAGRGWGFRGWEGAA